jgi:hypothetical protein
MWVKNNNFLPGGDFFQDMPIKERYKKEWDIHNCSFSDVNEMEV